MEFSRRPVKGYEGVLEVSEDGNIFSVDRVYARSDTGTLCKVEGRRLIPQRNKYGYMKVRTSISRRKFQISVHRAVAEAFVPNPKNLPQVNHIDGNKENNHKDNLEWTDNQGNQLHAVASGLGVHHKGKMAKRVEFTTFAISLDSCEIVAIMIGNEDMKSKGFDYRLVSAVVNGKRKSHNGCTFERIYCKGEQYVT